MMRPPQAGRLGLTVFLAVVLMLSTLLFAGVSKAQTAMQQQDVSPVYTLGVLPYLVPRNMAALYGPAARNMSQQLGKRVTLKTAGSFERFRENLRREVYDIAIIQPFDYPLAVDELGYLPLAQVNQQLRAVVVTRAGSSFKQLGELAGERVVMAPRHAATSRQGLWALKEAGLVAGEDVQVDFLSTHDACLHEILIGNATACITGPPPLKDFTARTGAELTVMMRTDPIPHVIALVHPRVPAADRARLESVMTGWSGTAEGQAILRPMRFPGWVKARPEEYAVMRQYLEKEQAVIDQSRGDEFVYGSFPYFQPRMLATQMAPMIAAFSDVVGHQVHFRTTPNFERFNQNLGHGQYDLALIRPYDYAVAASRGYLPVARVAKELDAHFYVLSDGPIQSLKDLKGKVVATPPEPAVMSRLGLEHLKKNGLLPGRDVKVVYRKGHDSCLQLLEQELAAACVTNPITLDAIYGERKDRFRVIERTPTIPSILFVLHQRYPQQLRERLRERILSWNDSEEGREIFGVSGLGPFSEVNAADYEALFR